jgi:hypothetical protein
MIGRKAVKGTPERQALEEALRGCPKTNGR